MEIRGIAILTIIQFVHEFYNDKYELWLNHLPPGSKKILCGTIDPKGWYPIEIAAMDPVRIICELFFSNDYKKGAWQTGRFSAEQALRTSDDPMLFASTTLYIIERGVKIFEGYYRPTKIVIESPGITNVRLKITDHVKDKIFEYRMAGWLERATELSGGMNPVIEIINSEKNGVDMLEYDLTWN